jgi:hypothetical protein
LPLNSVLLPSLHKKIFSIHNPFVFLIFPSMAFYSYTLMKIFQFIQIFYHVIGAYLHRRG